MKKDTRNLIIFFVATFIWTWAFYAPMALSGNSPYEMPWTILLILGGAGPSIVGVGMVFLTYDKEKQREFWRRCFSPGRIGRLWGSVIFLIFPALYAVGIAVDLATGGSLPGMEQLQSQIATPMLVPLAAFLSFMSGPWSEEFGWRGYALDPILRRFGPFLGSVGLGLIWGVWHLPLFFMPATWHGQMGFQLAGFWLFLVFQVALALIMTWVYTNTNRSILSGMLIHFTSNFTPQLLAPYSNNVELVYTVLVLVIGGIGCMRIDRKARSQEPPAAREDAIGGTTI